MAINYIIERIKQKHFDVYVERDINVISWIGEKGATQK